MAPGKGGWSSAQEKGAFQHSSHERRVPWVGVVQSSCPVCGLLAHLLLLISVLVLILATAVKEINKSHLKVDLLLLLLPLSHSHFRSQCSVYEQSKTEQGSAAKSELGCVPGFT